MKNGPSPPKKLTYLINCASTTMCVTNLGDILFSLFGNIYCRVSFDTKHLEMLMFKNTHGIRNTSD